LWRCCANILLSDATVADANCRRITPNRCAEENDQQLGEDNGEHKYDISKDTQG
jgi:hypothetical protein